MNYNNLAKIQILEFFKRHKWHTSWSWLIRCANMKWIWVALWKIQSRHYSVHLSTLFCPQMDRWIKWNNPKYQGSWGQHGAHLGPTGPRWVPCWPHELCYLKYILLQYHWVAEPVAVYGKYPLMCLTTCNDNAMHTFVIRSRILLWISVISHINCRNLHTLSCTLLFATNKFNRSNIGRARRDVSMSDKASYHKTLQSHEARKFVFSFLPLLWNLTDSSAAVLLSCLPNFKAVWSFNTKSWRSHHKMSDVMLK